MEILFTAILLLFLVFIYFIPSLIAIRRKHHNRLAIVVLNILAGWTFIGYIAAMVWACTSPTSTTHVAPRD